MLLCWIDLKLLGGNKIDYHTRLLHIILSNQIKLTCLWNYRLIIALLYDLPLPRSIFMSELQSTQPQRQHNTWFIPEGNTGIWSGREKRKNKNINWHYWHCRCMWRKRLWAIRRKRTTYCAWKHKQLPPQFTELGTVSQVLVFSSSADIKSGYWQVKMELEVREMAAFICCLGPLQFKVIYQEFSKPPLKGRWSAEEPASSGYLHAKLLQMGLQAIWQIQIVLSEVKVLLRWPRQPDHCMTPGNGGHPTAGQGSCNLRRGYAEERS